MFSTLRALRLKTAWIYVPHSLHVLPILVDLIAVIIFCEKYKSGAPQYAFSPACRHFIPRGCKYSPKHLVLTLSNTLSLCSFLNVRDGITKSNPRGTALSSASWIIFIFMPRFSKTQFNIIFPSTSRSSDCFPPSMFPDKNSVRTLYFSSSAYLARVFFSILP